MIAELVERLAHHAEGGVLGDSPTHVGRVEDDRVEDAFPQLLEEHFGRVAGEQLHLLESAQAALDRRVAVVPYLAAAQVLEGLDRPVPGARGDQQAPFVVGSARQDRGRRPGRGRPSVQDQVEAPGEQPSLEVEPRERHDANRRAQVAPERARHVHVDARQLLELRGRGRGREREVLL